MKVQTPSGPITANRQTLRLLAMDLFEAAESYEKRGYPAEAKKTLKHAHAIARQMYPNR